MRYPAAAVGGDGTAGVPVGAGAVGNDAGCRGWARACGGTTVFQKQTDVARVHGTRNNSRARRSASTFPGHSSYSSARDKPWRPFCRRAMERDRAVRLQPLFQRRRICISPKPRSILQFMVFLLAVKGRIPARCDIRMEDNCRALRNREIPVRNGAAIRWVHRFGSYVCMVEPTSLEERGGIRVRSRERRR